VFLEAATISAAPSSKERFIAFSIAAADKILHVNESLGGISRLTFQMSVAALPHVKPMRAIELLGTRVTPLVRKALSNRAILTAA
jgi:hypothetical protein